MSKSDTPNLDEVKAAIDAAMESWLKERSGESLTRWVHSRLDSAAEEIVRALLGFEREAWGGRWRIDHCNGRKSVASDTLESQCRIAVTQWLTDNMPMHMFVQPLEDADLKAIAEEARQLYRSTLRSKVREYASRRAEEDFGVAIKNSLLDLGKELKKKDG